MDENKIIFFPKEKTDDLNKGVNRILAILTLVIGIIGIGAGIFVMSVGIIAGLGFIETTGDPKPSNLFLVGIAGIVGTVIAYKLIWLIVWFSYKVLKWIYEGFKESGGQK